MTEEVTESSRKKKNYEEHENHERWLVSYADFITLLFAFFVVMYATSSNDQQKQKEFEKSVRSNLKLVATSNGSSVTLSDTNSDNLIPLEGFPDKSVPAEAHDYLNRFVDQKLESDDKNKIQQIRHDSVGVKISLASAQFFNAGGTKIKISALKTLDKLAEVLKSNNKKIIIEGHTDNTPVSKDAAFESNWELASLRATSIVRYLIKYHKIEPERISAISYADTKPLDSNDTEEGRSKNRRIEIYIVMD